MGEWLTVRPHPSLQGLVDRYVGYRLTGGAPGIHRGLPSDHLTLVVSVERDVDVLAHSDATQQPRRYRSLIGGLHASPTLIRHDGHQEGVSIDLTPAGSRALLGAPASALWSTTAAIEEVVGPTGTELWERVNTTRSWADRFAACDRVLRRLAAARRLTRRPANMPAEVDRAWRLLTRSHGGTTIRSLAVEVGWTRQHLTRQFTAELGLTPKTAARVIRFDVARRALQAPGQATSMAQVALDHGFYDQAHMTREFTVFAGCPPAQWLASEQVPSVQDNPPAVPQTSSI